jgi:hypothetical protein
LFDVKAVTPVLLATCIAPWMTMWWTYGWMPLLQQGGSGIKPMNDLFYYYK